LLGIWSLLVLPVRGSGEQPSGAAAFGVVVNSNLGVPGAGTAPGISLSSSSLSFGNQNLNTTRAPQTVTLTNAGTATLIILSIAASGDFAQANNCGGSVAPSGSCTISATFTPTTTGPRTGAITITDNAGSGTQAVGLSGTGTANPVPFVNEPLLPASAVPGGSSFALTVNGTGFVSNSVVSWNGSPRSTYFISDKQLTATINAADISTAGTASVTVVNPTPGGGTSNVDFFQVTIPTSSISLNRTDVATGIGPDSVAVGDFNGDGHQDLAITIQNCPVFPSCSPGTVSIMLGNGDGTFQPQTSYAVGGQPYSVALGDFNGDGNLDLAVANAFDNSVSVLLGNGDGTFQTPTAYATGSGPYVVISNDFNGDGRLDLAVVNYTGNTVSILLGNGDGTFQPQMTFATGQNPRWLATGDFNGDGKLDLAIANLTDNTVSILLGNGDGTFQTQTALASGAAPFSLVAADFNGDGNLDLAVANSGDNTLSILLGNGDGTFLSPAVYTAGASPESVIVGDFNGDGQMDLAIANFNGASVSLLLGNGDGTFQAQTSFATGSTPQLATAGDFNEDGRLDLVTANLTDNTVSVLLQAPVVMASPSGLTFGNQAVGTTSPAQTITLSNTGSAALFVSSIAGSGDFAQTNNCPLAPNTVAAGASCTISVTFTPTAMGTRTGAITVTDNASDSPQSLSLTGTGTAPVVSLSPTSLDFGNQLVGTSSAPQAITLTNTGTGTLTISGLAISGDFSQTNNCGSSVAPSASCTISVTFTPTTTGGRSGSITITDNASDSPQSLSLTGTGTAPVVSLSPTSLDFGNQLVGTASAPQAITLTNTGTGTLTISGLAISGDFSQASNCSSSVAPSGSCTISATFTPTTTGPRTGAITITDNAGSGTQAVGLSGTGTANPVPFVNEPLLPASAVPGGSSFALTVNGTGFVSNSVVSWNGSPRSTYFISDKQLTATINAADISTAGTASVTVVNPTPGGGTSNVDFFQVTIPTSSISLNRTDVATGIGPDSVAVGDFNGDGHQDLAITIQNCPVFPSCSPGTVSIMLGNGDGTFQPQTSYAVGGQPYSVALGDFNGDGNLDLAVANAFDNSVSVLLGNGDGTFQTPTAYATGSGPYVVISNDFNGDGRLDLAVVNYTGNTVSILLGNGDGTFQPQMTFATGQNPRWLATGDFNGDGKLDLAIANLTDNTVSILLGNGDGTFQTQTALASGAAPFSLVAADFNGDGNLDLAVANSGDNTLSILLGNGDGTFLSPAVYTAGASPESVIVGDFNGDGQMDLAIANFNGASVSLLLGNGDGTFQAQTSFATGSTPQLATAGDFNEDGRLDLVTANLTDNTVSVLLQAPVVMASPSGLTFGNQAVGTTSPAQTITLSNTGSAALFVSSIAGSGDFAQTNNCPLAPNTVAAGASCTISVTFTPTAMGTRTGAITVTDNASDSPQSLSLTGTGTAPVVSLSPTSLNFGNQLVGTVSAPQAITLTNTGTGTLTISGLAISGDFSQANNCGGSVAAGANCTISVTFSPSAPGARTGAITVTDNAPGSPQSVSLSGTGTAPLVLLSPTTLTFSNQDVGTTSAPQPVALSNTGTAPLTISGMATSGDFSQTNNCGSLLAAGASCGIAVTFTPTAIGTRTGVLTITDNNKGVGGSQQTVSLTGTGINPGGSVSPTSLSFGNQALGTTSAAKNVTLTSTGTTSLNISSITITGTNASDFAETNNCAASMAPGAKCTINVMFAPTQTGTRTAALTVSDNAANSPQTVAVSGSGVQPVGLSPTSLNFGNQAENTTSTPKTVTLTNNLNSILAISSITTNGDFAQTNTCGTSVPAKGSCTISVTFTPTNTGTRSGTLTVTDNAVTSPQTVSLTGTGLLQVTVSPTSLTFASQKVGTTSTAKNVTLTNNLNAALAITSISASGDFAETNTCGSSVAARASCTISVTFTPTAIGTRTGVVSIADNAAGSPQTVSLTGTGQAPAVTLSPTSLSFGSQTVGTTSAPQSSKLTNTGNATLSITSISASGDFAETNTCRSSVSAGASCTISVTFTPRATGTRTGAVSIADNAAGSPQTISLTGTGQAPAVTLSPTSLTFGSQTMFTTSAPQSSTLTNTGTGTLSITSISASGDFAETNTCGSSVAAGASCTIGVTFTPTASGTRTGAVSIADNAAGSPQTISQNGTGVQSSTPIVYVKYWIIIFKENRTFNQYLGWYPNVSGGTTTVVHNNGQTSKAYHMPDVGHYDPNHDYVTAHNAVNGGAMNSFDLAEGAFGTTGAGFESLSQYTRNDLPIYSLLADTYLVWDNLFPSVNSESYPNHLYTIAASSGPPNNAIIDNTLNGHNASWGFDSNSPNGGQCLNSSQKIVSCSPGLDIPDIVSELNAAGRIAQIWGAAFNVTGYTWVAANGIKNLCGLSTVGNTPCPMSGAGGNFWHPFAGSSNAATLVNAIAAENGTHNSIGEVLIVTPNAAAEHPASSLCSGEDWTRQIIQAVYKNPAVYNQSAIVVTWDDYGGFYDPVPPTSLDNFGLGVRVPALIISPFADTRTWSNHVYHGASQAGFEAILKLIETWASAKGTPIATLSSRDANTIDMSNAFNFTQTPIAAPTITPRTCSIEATPLVQNPSSTYYFYWSNPVSPGQTSTPQTMTLTNQSSHNIVMGTLTTEMYAAIVNDTCSGQTLAPNKSCTFGAEFAPPPGAPQGKAWGLIHAPYACPQCLDPPAAYGLAPGHSPVDTGLEGVVGK
jgi:phospholipase C